MSINHTISIKNLDLDQKGRPSSKKFKNSIPQNITYLNRLNLSMIIQAKVRPIRIHEEKEKPKNKK